MAETRAKLRKKKKKLHSSEVLLKELMSKANEVSELQSMTEERAALVEKAC